MTWGRLRPQPSVSGSRVWWPAGLQELTPAQRHEALERGYWPDGDHIVTRDGRRLWRPGTARALRGDDG